MKSLYCILFPLLFFNVNVYGQKILDPAQLEDYNEQAKQKLATVKNSFSKIANRDVKGSIKDLHISLVSQLFKEGAIVQVSSTNGSLIDYSINKYLKHIKNYHYQTVIMEYVVEGEYFSDFQKVIKNGEVQYVATAKVVQRFCGFLENRTSNSFNDCDYSDITEKEIEVVLEKVTTYVEGERWVIKLGDITVASTK